jgi:putative N6-adenine-specific DNA methylase
VKQDTDLPLIAKTVFGLEPVLARELGELGATGVEIRNRAVAFQGDTALLYRANYCCRTALRILKPLFVFTLTTQEDLYTKVKEFPWETVMDPSSSLAIDAVISYTVFTNSQFVAQRSKDAIVDRLRDQSGKRPSVDLENPDLRISVHLFRDQCTVSLDSSGSSLHKRGYRKSTGLAPISEVLAAGLIKLSEWDPAMPLYDPMCGSGTLLLEAALLAKHIPSGYFRESFGFMKWKDFDQALWQRVKAEADSGITSAPVALFGSDQASRAIRSAMENFRYIGMENEVRFVTGSFADAVPPAEKGFIICNPPYDERIAIEDSMAFYKMIGDVLKQNFAGYTAWFISSDLEAIKFVGLRPSRRIAVFNGPLECRFIRFDLYRGKKGYQQEQAV